MVYLLNGKVSVVWFFSLLFLIAFVSSVPQTFNVHGRLSDSNGALTGTYSMNFTLYDSYTGGGALWSGNYSVTTDDSGVYNVILSNIDLPFSEQYYLGLDVEGDGEMSPRMNLTSSAYAFRAGSVLSSGVVYDANVDLGAYNFSVGTDTFFVDALGNIGIGTSDPKNELNIIGDLNVTGLIYGNTSTSTSIDGYDSSFFMPLNKSVYGDFDFNGGWESGGFTIKDGDIYAQRGWFYNISSLEVSHLNVNGSMIPFDGFDNTFDLGSSVLRWRDLFVGRNVNVGGGSFYVNSTNGLVGIGTVSPGAELDVVGDIVLSGSGSAEITTTGDSSLLLNPDGTGRLELGSSSNYIDAGENVIFNGGDVGVGLVSPSYKLDVNGSVNIDDASAYLYDGVQALRLSMGTDDFYANTFIGASAGNTSATRQTAIGSYTGRYNLGNEQTALGYYAGYSNDGIYQTAIGSYAGRYNLGDYHTAIGYQAGRDNEGDRVLGLGVEAAWNNSGDDVVAIGYQAGKDNEIANQFIVKQANVNALPLIQGNFSSGNVGIGTETPSQKLDVVGNVNVTGNLTISSAVGSSLIYNNGTHLIID